jgi:hypothetical protein
MVPYIHDQKETNTGANHANPVKVAVYEIETCPDQGRARLYEGNKLM